MGRFNGAAGSRPLRPIALGLLLAATFSLPGLAAEPDGPATLITPTEAVRIAVQGVLSAKPGTGTGAIQKDALIEFYSAPDQRLLWVDNNGLNRARQNGDGGNRQGRRLRLARVRLRPARCRRNGFRAEAQATGMADAEVKSAMRCSAMPSDARGGRIDLDQASIKNLDPTLALPRPLGGDRIDGHPVRSRRPICAASSPTSPNSRPEQELIELRGGKVEEKKACRGRHPRRAHAQIRHGARAGGAPQEAARRAGRKRRRRTKFDEANARGGAAISVGNGARPDGMVGPGTRDAQWRTAR